MGKLMKNKSLYFLIFSIILFATNVSAVVNGVDVSHWQENIDWGKVYGAGYRFSFAKATEGTSFTDSQFSTNMVNGNNAGLLMGAYHFARPDINADATAEAKHFVSVARPYLKKGYLRPVLDLERGSSLGKTKLSNWVHTWMNTVKKETSIEPIIYVNSNYANNYLDSSVNKYDLWIAHWTYDPLSTPDTGIWSSWDFWQYSNKGTVSGISGDADLDLFNGDINQLQSYKILVTEKTLIKSADDQKVYWFQNNTLYWIKDEATFNLMQPIWQWGNIITYDSVTFNQILNTYKRGLDFISDGILMKIEAQPAVYLIENNQKRAFFNYEAFTSYEFKDEDIIIVTQTLLNSIPLGELIYAIGYQSGRDFLFKDAFNRNGGKDNLGYAKTTTQNWGSGQIQYFQRQGASSAIIFNPDKNIAYATYGAIYTKYLSGGTGAFGLPVGDENWGIDSSVTGSRARYQKFEGGMNGVTSINHHFTGPNRGLTVETHGPILDKWVLMGYGASCAGLPMRDIYASGGGLRADFENGYLFYNGVTTTASCEAQPPSCSDGIKNQDETDVDCGGSCPKCSDWKICSINNDCQSNYCNPNRICSVPTCSDGWRNGNEEGVDCGGNCLACPTPECQSPTGSIELTANAPSNIGQHYPAIAMNANGNFVVAWHSNDGSGDGIFVQRFNADGSKTGPEFRANTYTTGMQRYPDVAMDANGNFVITWESYEQDGSDLGIYAQRFNKEGIPQNPEFRVNTYTTNSQFDSAIAMDANGNFVITWTSWLQDGSYAGIFYQRYNANGEPQNQEFQVNTYSTDYQRYPDVAMDANGNFVITWVSNPGQQGWDSVYAQRYDRNGNVLGNGNFEVNTHKTSGGSKTTPAIAMDPQGNFVITWTSLGQDGSNWGVFARKFDRFGNALTNEIPVNTYTFSDQFQPAIAMDALGNFVIGWRGYGGSTDGFDIFARRFDFNGNPISNEFEVNVYTPKDEDAPVVAMTSKTNFIITWYSWRSDNQYDVIYRIYKCLPLCSNGAKDPSETDVDCGGSCAACADGKSCLINTDCQSNYCNPNKICSTPSCFDSIKNQDETDVDCGGSCQDCINGKNCLINIDCQSNYCNPNKICSSISCFDRIKNGDELGVDCGGSCDKKCEVKLRILAMPIKSWNSQQEFENMAKERIDYFVNDIPLKNCPEKVEIIYGDIAKSYQDFECSNSFFGLNSFIHRSGFDINSYDIVTGFIKRTECSGKLGEALGTTIWAHTETGPEIFAHEVGHIYDLEDEYCSNQAGSRNEGCNDGGKPADYDGDGIISSADINFLSMEYNCDPTKEGNCCGEKAGRKSCYDMDYGICCLGNEVVVNEKKGRSIMSYANIVDASGNIVLRSFERSAKEHLATYPKLRCESPGGGDISGGGTGGQVEGKIISLNIRVYKDNTAQENYILLQDGTPTDYHRTGDYKIAVVNNINQELWENSIDIGFGWTGPIIENFDYSDIIYPYKDLYFKIPYSQEMQEIKLYYKDDLIFSKILEFCDLDGICDTTESHNTCASDCPLEKPDIVCNYESDGICDPDCFIDVDPDCTRDEDKDDDNIVDSGDNCIDIKNPNQDDLDKDGIGDVCDEDIDNDGVANDIDNCLSIANPNQEDTDKNGIADACNDFEDRDNDEFADNLDNCPTINNPSQENSDNDNNGDACDICPQDSENDKDNDGICGNIDNCPLISNPNQEDLDKDGIGDVCDTQTCNNGILETGEECDMSALGGKVCNDLGFDAGELECSSACKFDTSQCVKYQCGNNKIEGTEECDGTDLAGQTCQTFGFKYGALSCKQDCTDYNKAQCTNNICGNEIVDIGETCDDGNTVSGDGCSSTCKIEVFFLRGDSNIDGSVDVSDSVKTLLYLFAGAELNCLDAADADDSGEIDITDAIYTLNFLFIEGPAIKQPYPNKGTDPTQDSLDCKEYNPVSGGGGSVETVKDALNNVKSDKTMPNQTKSFITNYLEEIPKGSLSLTSYPSSTYIYLDNSYKGMTPKSITALAAGNYAVKLTKYGYKDYNAITNIQSGKESKLSVTLQVTASPSPSPSSSPSSSPYY